MPAWLQLLLTILKDNPGAILELIELIKRIVNLFEKYPALPEGLGQLMKTPPPQ